MEIDKTHKCPKCNAYMKPYGFSGYYVYECPSCKGKKYPPNTIDRTKIPKNPDKP